MQKVTVTYTPALLSRAVACFWRRYLGLRGVGVFVLLWACLALLWALSGWTWYVIAFTTAASLVPVIFVGFYILHRRRVLANLARLEGGLVEFQFHEDTLEMTSSLGSSKLKWATFERLWKFPDLWLLFISKGQYIILPVPDLPPEARDRVDRKVANKA